MGQNKKINTDSTVSWALAPVILSVLFLFGLLSTWRKWPDILVDFGRELYIPWQISSGSVLYKDIAHIFGPFSQYLNASLFKLFGVSYSTIIVANIVVLALFLTVLYLFIANTSSRLTAFMSCSTIILLFAFSQYTYIGNYNFISPYSHEATHGIVISLFLIYQLWYYSANKRKHNCILAGFLFGLLSLTKVEYALSGTVVAGFFFFLYWLNTKDIKPMIKSVGLFFTGSSIPLILFLAYFARVMPFKDALTAICGSWIGIIKNADIAINTFYITGMGLDNPIANSIKMVFHAIYAIATVMGILFLCHSINKYRNKLLYVCFCAMLLGVIISLVFFLNPYKIGRSLPVLNIIAIIYLFYLYFIVMKFDRIKANTHVPMLLWSVFSLCMLWKMVLFSRLFHYGFVLALPSVVLLVTMLVWYLPEWFDKRFSGGSIVRIIMVIIVVLIPFKFIQASYGLYHAKTFPIGIGGDRIKTYDKRIDSHGPIIANAVEWINLNLGAKETFVAVPEGIMLNYLTRRKNPTPYVSFMVPEMRIFNEDTILKSFVKHTPDYILLVHKNTSEYGVGFFGQDSRYGKKIIEWIKRRYYPVCLFGNEPLQNNQFGIRILRKRK